jgi:hypothetical protein
MGKLNKMNYIRKISVGADYKNAMHYIINQEVLGGSYVISDIAQEQEGFSVWVKKNEESVKWKEFKDIPIVVEYNINLI